MNEEYKKYQHEKHLVAILIMIILLLVAAIVSVLILKGGNKDKTKPKSPNTTSTTENTNKKQEQPVKKEEKEVEKIDDTKGFYYIKKGNGYELLPEVEDEEKTIISFSYPIINSKDESVTKINDEIKKLYSEKEKNILIQNGSTCTCIKINGTKKCGRSVNFYEYKIIETNDLLNLKIYDQSVTHCASGGSELEKSYFISKTTGKVLSNSEVLKEFNYKNSKLITSYNKYLNKLKNKHQGDFDNYKNINSIDELTLVLIDEDNKIKLGINGPGYGNGIGFDLIFDGNIIIGYDADEEDGILKSE